ncbi:cysteine--tRNA ligase [Candidatus Uhrbacteria bacterium]|nr:cysteine--tRNA ligase [Candidatus Uhrbacteria bacterium]
MPLKLYNTLTKNEEEFVPLKKEETLRQAQDGDALRIVTMYTCGPTVYGRPHIGNYSSFLMADLLKRWLQAGHQYRVLHVKNITDVGHLLHDADQGDDKVQKEAEKEKVHPLEVAQRYTEQYLEDEAALNMLEPDHRPRASETIPEMIAIITELLQRGNAYETEDGIYFSVETFAAYGTLSGNTLENLSAGSRIAVDEQKRHPADFALWKKTVAGNAHHILRWKFPSGEKAEGTTEDASAGFPGWHIECSAMSKKFLGETFDIHTGGEDNIFPHHECEIAQSECASGKQFVRMWLHKRRIDLGSAKMSKSLGNVLTLPDIVAKNYSPLDLRYYLLSVHYRTNLKFSWKGMDDAKKARRKITEWMSEVKAEGRSDPAGGATTDASSFITIFTEAMNADLNTPAALAVIFEAMNAYRAKKPLDAASRAIFIDLIELARHTFGCFEEEAEEAVPDTIQKLLNERSEARAQKNFTESDRLRDEIKKSGYEVRDAGRGQTIKKL